jgi:hypothetical protein
MNLFRKTPKSTTTPQPARVPTDYTTCMSDNGSWGRDFMIVAAEPWTPPIKRETGRNGFRVTLAPAGRPAYRVHTVTATEAHRLLVALAR